MKRIDILKLLESGQITVDEASKLLNNVEFEDDDEYELDFDHDDDLDDHDDHEDEDDHEDDDDECYADPKTGKMRHGKEHKGFDLDLDVESLKKFVTDIGGHVVNVAKKIGSDIDKKITEYQAQEEAKDTRQIRVSLRASSIYIKSGEVQDFTLQVMDPETGEEIVLPERFEVVRSGESIRIEEQNKGFLGISFSEKYAEAVQIELTCPSSVNYNRIKVGAVSGSVELRGMKAATISASTVSGSATISECSCEQLKISTVSGSAEVEESSANRMKLASVSGEIRCFGIGEGVEAFWVNSVSGVVRIDKVTAVLKQAKINSASGSINFRSDVLQRQNYRITSMSGRIQAPYGELSRDKRSMQHSTEDGNALTLSTISGPIRLEEGAEPTL